MSSQRSNHSHGSVGSALEQFAEGENIEKQEHLLDEFEEAEKEIFGAELFPNQSVAEEDNKEDLQTTEETQIYNNEGSENNQQSVIATNAPFAHLTANGIETVRPEKHATSKVVPVNMPVTILPFPASVPNQSSRRGSNFQHSSSSRSNNSSNNNHTGRSSVRVLSHRIASGTNIQNKLIEIAPSNKEAGSQTTHNSNSEGIHFLNGASSLRLNTGNIRTTHLSVMMSILQDPIQCGFLLHFCTQEHNEENMCFIMMVSRFRDAVSQDIAVWPKSWSEVDKEVEGQNIEDLLEHIIWPSKRLQKSIIEKLVRAIWDNFLSDDAITQICMPAKVAINTKQRIKLLDLYGPDVFGETLIDPIKTMNKDVLPRFLASSLYSDMKLRIAEILKKQTIASMTVPPPEDNLILKINESITDKRLFTLKEITSNRLLYDCFLHHLEKALSAENLLCCRMIEIFENLTNESDKLLLQNTAQRGEKRGSGKNTGSTVVGNGAGSSSGSSGNHYHHHNNSNNRQSMINNNGNTTTTTNNNNNNIANNLQYQQVHAEAVNQAWLIYRYFVAPEAPYEVSLHSRHKKELMISLAKPYALMFEELKKSAFSILTVNFNAFKFTDEYRQLWKIVKEEKSKLSWGGAVSNFKLF